MKRPATYSTEKDTRKSYKYQRIDVNGTFVEFDGKLDTKKNTLQVYRMYGDVGLFDEALMNFCLDNNISSAVKHFK